MDLDARYVAEGFQIILVEMIFLGKQIECGNPEILYFEACHELLFRRILLKEFRERSLSE